MQSWVSNKFLAPGWLAASNKGQLFNLEAVHVCVWVRVYLVKRESVCVCACVRATVCVTWMREKRESEGGWFVQTHQKLFFSCRFKNIFQKRFFSLGRTKQRFRCSSSSHCCRRRRRCRRCRRPILLRPWESGFGSQAQVQRRWVLFSCCSLSPVWPNRSELASNRWKQKRPRCCCCSGGRRLGSTQTGFGNLTLLLIICTDMFYYSSKEFKWVKVAALAKLWLVVQEMGAAKPSTTAKNCARVPKNI